MKSLATKGLCVILLFSNSVAGQILGSWNCLDFDGSTDYVNIPHNNAQNPGSSFTVEAWIKADSYATNVWENTIVSKDTWSSVSEGWVIRCGAGGKLSFNLALNNNGNWYEIQTSALMSTNIWYHVAGTFDGSSMKVFLNGKQVGSLTQSGSITATTVPMKIGNIARPSTSRFFNGQIDEVRVWNEALPEATLKEYMCQFIDTAHPYYNKLIAYYNINNGGGTSVTDVSGNSQTGTVYGATWTPSGAALGNESTYLYPSSWSGNQLSLAHMSGDSMVVSNVSGSPDGVHLYRVDNHPNFQLTPLGVILFYDTRYWGVFPTSGNNVSFDIDYNYGGYPSIIDKSKLNFSFRSANDDTTWAGVLSANDTNLTQLSLSSMNKGEYIMGASDDLTSFSLLNPVNPTTLNLQGMATQTVDFNWTASVVGGSAAPKYKVHLDYDTADFSSPLKTYPTTNNNLDTFASVSFQDLASLMNQLNLEYGQTLSAQWTAEAYAGPLSKYASSPHDISITRGILSSDFVFNFFVIAPTNYDSIVAVDGVPGTAVFNWTRAKSTAGGDMDYELQFAGHSGVFSNPVGVFSSDNNAIDTLASLSHSDLVIMLKSLNLQSGQVFLFKWRAKASIGSLDAYSSDSQYVYMSWEENPFIGIKEGSDLEFTVWPNPASDRLLVEISKNLSADVSLTLFDFSGKAVRTWLKTRKGNISLSLIGLRPGYYTLELATPDIRGRQKIIIN
ncbi:MAG: LamG-like jellyroll fold domain-containing protein [Vicingaceae bacterium]